MQRRDVIAGLLVAAAIDPTQARRAKIYRILFVGTGQLTEEEMGESSSDRHIREFFAELRRLGYVQGENLFFEAITVYAVPNDHLPRVAHDVVGRKPDLIVALSNPVVRELQKATTSIPIVAFVADPLASGLVRSLARPGGNITGVSLDPGFAIWGKRLALLKEGVPSIARVGFLALRSGWEAYRAALREAEHVAGIPVVGPPLELENQYAEYRRVITAMVQQGADGLIVSDEVQHYLSPNREWIADLAKDFGLPAIYPNREQVEVGGLMAYSLDGYALWRHAADQIAQILGGTRPGEISFYQPRKFDLIVNLKTAKVLGLSISQSLLARADEVIE